MCLSVQVHEYQGTLVGVMENSQELVLSCHLVGPRDGTHSVRMVHGTLQLSLICPDD